MLAKPATAVPQWAVALAILSLPLLSNCSSDSGLFSGSASNFAKRDWGISRDWNQTAKDEAGASRPVSPEDLVNADGQCGGSTALNFQAGPDATRGGSPGLPAAPPPGTALPRGIALGMTECEVVGTAGANPKVEIATGERGERQVVLTYLQGGHPGIYRFEAGRLKSIERSPSVGQPAVKPGKKAAKPTGN
jgi:hypothetical protein